MLSAVDGGKSELFILIRDFILSQSLNLCLCIGLVIYSSYKVLKKNQSLFQELHRVLPLHRHVEQDIYQPQITDNLVKFSLNAVFENIRSVGFIDNFLKPFFYELILKKILSKMPYPRSPLKAQLGIVYEVYIRRYSFPVFCRHYSPHLKKCPVMKKEIHALCGMGLFTGTCVSSVFSPSYTPTHFMMSKTKSG